MRYSPHILICCGLSAALALAVFAWLSLFGDEGRCWVVGVLAVGAAALAGGRVADGFNT